MRKVKTRNNPAIDISVKKSRDSKFIESTAEEVGGRRDLEFGEGFGKSRFALHSRLNLVAPLLGVVL